MKIFKYSIIVLAVFLKADPYPEKFEGNFKDWQNKQKELISFFLPKNPVILIAGGLYGNEALNFKICWKKSNIIVFEPNPHAFEILSSRVKDKDIKIYPLALNIFSSITQFYVCHGSDGKSPIFEHASSLLPPSSSMKIHYKGPIIDVLSVNLDEWCMINGVDHIDFMRLNLQGMELQCLKSSPKILKTVKAIHINTFMYPFRSGMTKYMNLKNFLERKGFVLLSHWYRENLEGNAIFIRKDFFYSLKTDNFLKNNFVRYPKYHQYLEPFFQTYYYLDDDGDPIKNSLKNTSFDTSIGSIINDLTKEGSLAIDVGAHIGAHTINMSKKVGATGAVIAFEPNEKRYMELLSNLELNNCRNVISIAKSLKEKTISNGNEERVSLDSLNVNDLSLIKIDDNNFKYPLIKGSEVSILQNKPVIIFERKIDYKKEQKKEDFFKTISLIESYGYKIYVICQDNFIAFPISYDQKLKQYKNNFQKFYKD